MSDARAAVLGRIRAALGSDAPAAVPVLPWLRSADLCWRAGPPPAPGVAV